MIKFSKDKVLLLHKLIAQETGGSIGVRDEALLDSALENAFAGFDGQEFYPTKEEKRARSSNCFNDGSLYPVSQWEIVFTEVCSFSARIDCDILFSILKRFKFSLNFVSIMINLIILYQ